jgi:hypothetical protein
VVLLGLPSRFLFLSVSCFDGFRSLTEMLRCRGLKPGQKTLDAIGGAHKLQSWPHNILTGDSRAPDS